MLRELRVENYAVIDQVAVEFGPGLNLLTGETGAGKSILIDALALLLGAKASPDVIRHGAERAVVSAVFEAEDGVASRAIATILAENGLDDSEEGEVILKREILANGKGRVFVNNQPATVAVLKQLGPNLASVHAQLESILTFDSAARLMLLDRFCGSDTSELREVFTRVREIRIKIADLERDEQDRLRLVDLWSFQKKEIEAAQLANGEDEKLEAEKRVLANSERLFAAAMGAYGALYEDEANALALLRSAERQLEELARFDASFREAVAAITAARAAAEDISATARAFADNINASPERLAEIEDRLAMIDRLKRKYGQNVEAVIAYGEDVVRRLHEVENKDEVLASLKKELLEASEAYLSHAKKLSKKRGEGGKKLERLVEAEVNDLAMNAKFKIELTVASEESAWTSTGIDSVTYLIATNPGEPLKPVDEIASGGELARVMLALKASVEEGAGPAATSANGKGMRSRHQRTMIFDEIDTGIGGRAAEAVGKKLKSLSRNNQILCITHLPQIASFADQHFVIEKREMGGRTKTRIRPLEPVEQTEEIARMLSGAKLTDASLKHAEQLIKANR